MPIFETLAQDDGFPVQGILFLVIAIFSFLKWLYENIVQKGKTKESESSEIEDLYDQYRDEIKQRQTQVTHPNETAQISSPPPVPFQATKPKKPAVSQPPAAGSPQQMQKEIERLRLKKERSAYNIDFPSHDQTEKSKPVTGLKAELQKKNSLRKAILLREIIGPPKALQD